MCQHYIIKPWLNRDCEYSYAIDKTACNLKTFKKNRLNAQTKLNKYTRTKNKQTNKQLTYVQ